MRDPALGRTPALLYMPPRRGSKRKKAAPTVSPRVLRDAIPRALLGRQVQRQVRRFGLTRAVAAAIVGDAASQVSRLMTGHIGEFSSDRLVKMLNGLGTDVVITLRHPSRLGRKGKTTIQVK